ncbi:ATP-binding protein, partial [Dokdonella sp.]
MTLRLREVVDAALQALAPGPILVACSGGLDSTTLLHALACSDAARARGLRAVHIDHGIHEDSGQWARHCEAFAGSLKVELSVRRVTVTRL